MADCPRVEPDHGGSDRTQADSADSGGIRQSPPKRTFRRIRADSPRTKAAGFIPNLSNSNSLPGDPPCDGIVYEPSTKKYALYTGELTADSTGHYAYKKTCKKLRGS